MREIQKKWILFKNLHFLSNQTHRIISKTMRCPSCDDSPCKATFYKEVLHMELDDIDEYIDNRSEKRNRLYSLYVLCEDGCVGDLDHHPVPICVQTYILSICPDEHTENDSNLN